MEENEIENLTTKENISLEAIKIMKSQQLYLYKDFMFVKPIFKNGKNKKSGKEVVKIWQRIVCKIYITVKPNRPTPSVDKWAKELSNKRKYI